MNLHADAAPALDPRGLTDLKKDRGPQVALNLSQQPCRDQAIVRSAGEGHDTTLIPPSVVIFNRGQLHPERRRNGPDRRPVNAHSGRARDAREIVQVI
jgi:hypothetical protein